MITLIPIRYLVRIISFTLALLTVITVYHLEYKQRAHDAEQKLTYQYLNSLDSLCAYMTSMDATLQKIIYSGDPTAAAMLSSMAWRESDLAKTSLQTLPAGALPLENIYQFLSWTSEYASQLSRKFSAGEALSAQDVDMLRTIKHDGDQLLQEMLSIQDAVHAGSISLHDAMTDLAADGMEAVAASKSLIHGSQEFQNGISSDAEGADAGLFENDEAEQNASLLLPQPFISPEQAREVAGTVAGHTDLEQQPDGNGVPPSYVFADADTTISITKYGGYLSYMLKNRRVVHALLSPEECIRRAAQLLETLSFPSLQASYYEVRAGIITIEFVAMQNNVVLYPDLIRISVAMNDGAIVMVDTRAYLTNHTKRENVVPLTSMEDAAKNISPALQVDQTTLCIIAIQGTEILCYELQCQSDTGESVWVYISATTGRQEQLLLVHSDETGMVLQ